MISRIVAFSARRPLVILMTALLLGVAGFFATRSLSRDVIPDLSDPQVVLVAEWMGHPASEIATNVTEVLTQVLDGVPGSIAVRGSSMSGMAYIDVVFGSVAGLHSGRAEIAARIDQARQRLPAGVRIQVGPEASSTGWIFQYAIVSTEERKTMPMGESLQQRPSSLLPIRQFQDDVLRPALSAIDGVAEVASIGGESEQVLIETTADQLHGVGAAFSDVVAAVRSTLARAPSPSRRQLEETLLLPGQGTHANALELKQVGRVSIAPEMESGIADANGAQAVVGGIVVARRGANITTVIAEVKKVLERERAHLPAKTKLGVIYDRSELTGRVEHTLFVALAEEIGIVVLVVLLFLLHPRSALVPLATLPLVVLLTFLAMRLLGVTATVMSLGGIAIALGMAVDADLVALEACHRGLEAEGTKPTASRRRSAILSASGAFAPAILTSLVIAALAFVPVFAFGGETGRLLGPLALTKTIVVLVAAVVALTVAPALRDRLLGGRIIPELANPLTSWLVKAYRPFVHFALSRPGFTLITAALAAASCLPLLPRLGREFLPRIDEGDLLYMPTTSPGVSAEAAATELARLDQTIAKNPEVSLVFGKVGRADSATDPAPLSMAETIIRLRPRSEWPQLARPRWYSTFAPGPLKRLLGLIWPEKSARTTSELVASLDGSTKLPGWTNAWTAPVRARMEMMATGVRTPVGIRIVAADSARLDELGEAVQKTVLGLPNTKSAVYETLAGETRLSFEPDAAAMARHHVDPAVVQATADLLLTGGAVGEIPSIDRSLWDDPNAEPTRGPTQTTSLALTRAIHLPLRVRVSLAPPWLAVPKYADDLLREATVRATDGNRQPVPLGLLGRPRYIDVRSMVHTERGENVGYVYVDLADGADLATYVDRARSEVERVMALGDSRTRPGERIEWTGQYELLRSGERRLQFLAPLVALLMLGLLLLQFRSLTEALIVLASVPFALVGSIWTLYALDYKLSAPVWVGLLSVVGLAMQTGVVMVVYIDDAFYRRLRAGQLRNRDDIIAAHAEGTVRRLRPKIMTISTMGAGLLPLLWAQGAGAEIMKRIAAPMVGGLATSAFLTLEVIPVLYTIWRSRQLRAAEHRAVPLEQVVGPAPAWAAGTNPPTLA